MRGPSGGHLGANWAISETEYFKSSILLYVSFSLAGVFIVLFHIYSFAFIPEEAETEISSEKDASKTQEAESRLIKLLVEQNEILRQQLVVMQKMQAVPVASV